MVGGRRRRRRRRRFSGVAYCKCSVPRRSSCPNPRVHRKIHSHSVPNKRRGHDLGGGGVTLVVVVVVVVVVVAVVAVLAVEGAAEAVGVLVVAVVVVVVGGAATRADKEQVGQCPDASSSFHQYVAPWLRVHEFRMGRRKIRCS